MKSKTWPATPTHPFFIAVPTLRCVLALGLLPGFAGCAVAQGVADGGGPDAPASAADVFASDAPREDSGVGQDAPLIAVDARGAEDVGIRIADGGIDAAVIDPCGTPEEQRALALANEARMAAGIGPLRCDPAMVLVARGHSEAMCAEGRLFHVSASGEGPDGRMRRGGVSFTLTTENIAMGTPSGEATHMTWMSTPGNRVNIEDARYGRMGVGLSECRGRYFWTQVFAD